MSGFDVELRTLARSLSLPEPARSRMLLELRRDLEAMAAALETRGLDEPNARRRALEALLPGPDSLRELEAVHRPLHQRLVDRFSSAGHRVERLLIGGLAVAQLAGIAGAMAAFDLLADPSPVLWPVLVLAALVLTAGVAKLFALYAGSAVEPRRGLSLVPALGGLTLAVAFGGVVVELHGLAGRQALGTAGAAELVGWLHRSSGMLTISLLTASVAGLLWLAAAVRVAGIERTEAVALGYSLEQGRTT
jgi:hypothetical protein